MTRSTGLWNLLAVATLMGGCAGEGPTPYDLVPGDHVTPTSAGDMRLASVHQALGALSYSTYVGFAGDDTATAIAVDSSGNTYLTGTTNYSGSQTVYVAKMDAAGSNVYFTYFPGTQATAIAVDSSGCTYVASTSTSGQAITKFNAAGKTILYTANLGWDTVSGIKVDSSGDAYITGSYTNGTSGLDVAVGKLNPAGTAFLYVLAFGGTGADAANGIDIDKQGNAYLTGTTNSVDFPLKNAAQTALKGTQDAFVAKLNAAGDTLVYSSYLGGKAVDYATGIAVDGNLNAYITGTTGVLNNAESFPVKTGMAQTTPGGGGDAFAAKFGPAGALLYATYIGGSGSDLGTGIAVTNAGIAYVIGTTDSTNLPTTSLAYQRTAPGGRNAFVVQLSATFDGYTYASYLGGSGADLGAGIALNSGGVFLTGSTGSTNFPTSVYSSGGQVDAFVTKFNP